MVLDLLKKTFGLNKKNSTAAAAESKPVENEEDRVVEFVRFVVSKLVENPEDVDVQTETDEQRMKLLVKCHKDDVGKVIGKRGKTVSAIRALANGAARRAGRKVSIDVLD